MYMYSLCNDTFCNITSEEKYVVDIISVLSVNKAIGPDCISHKMHKSTILTVAKPFSMLFNKSFMENIFHFVRK